MTVAGRARPGPVRRWLRALAVAVLAWLAIGALRAPRVAEDALIASEGRAGMATSGVSTEFAAPVVPPLWLVNVGGDVIEPGSTEPVYRAHQLVLVEPITGIVIPFGQG